LLASDERRAEVLLREMDLEMWQSRPTENVGVFRRLRWASRGAAEAVRILATYQRASGLTLKSLEALERYRKFHEAAELVLVGRFSYPVDPVATAPLADFWDESEAG
jgi:hypothetical protein